MLNVGKRIKERRIELGLSAEELAPMVGLSPATIYRYENGDIKKVNTTKLQPFAKALQTTEAYLMGWCEESASGNGSQSCQAEKDNANEVAVPSLSAKSIAVARAYDQMSGYGKAIIDAIITQENLHKHIFIANVRNDLVLDGTGRWEVKASAISEQCELETDDDFRYPSKQESDVRVLE